MSARTHDPSDQDWLDNPWTDAAEPRRRGKKKPVGRRQLAQMTADEDSDQDDVIRRLRDLGHVTEIIAELKSGKEATAYVLSLIHI